MSDAVPLSEVDLAERVEEWIDWAEAARQLGVTVAKVRTMIRDHELAAARCLFTAQDSRCLRCSSATASRSRAWRDC
jgi:hypothetical protein